MKKSFFVVFICFLLTVILYSFIDTDPYFLITQQDVVFKKPKGFPKPVYDLEKNKTTPEGFMLGRKLFYDPILSKDSSISCGSCHQQFAAFTQIDHAFSHGVNGLIGKRNAPALQNLIWKDAFMLDGGVNLLNLQPISPITNPLEMNESLATVLTKLQGSKEYIRLFKQVYKDSIITSERLMKSLSQFLALLISADSRYDRYTHGKDTLSKSEKNGLKLFRANCASCHKEPLFTDNSYRNNGLAIHPFLKDSGRLIITGVRTDLLKFKVPTLRNIAVTYPYMHDGRFYNLKQVLNHYTKLNSSDEGLDPVLKKGIKLNDVEKTDMIAFLKTLTDKNFLKDRRFANLNSIIYKPKIVTQAETKTLPLNEEELVKKFKNDWDTIALFTVGGIPQYISYIDKLDKVTKGIANLTKKQTAKFPKLETLRLELLESKKHKEAIRNYMVYGQPASLSEITDPCKKHLESKMSDSVKVKIVSAQVKESSKKGWVVLVAYTVQNKQGSSVIKAAKLEVKYNPIDKTYLVLKEE
jgi:cytochrome c peroxidase